MKGKKLGHSIYGIRFVFVAIALILPAISPFFMGHDPYQVEMGAAFLAPCKDYPLGTDNLGRCVLCRILAGSRTSIYTALLVVMAAMAAGTAIGLVAGFFGGILDDALVKIILVFQAFPAFVLSVAIAGILGVGIENGILALLAVYWTTYAKLARSLTVSIAQKNYIFAARHDGVPVPRIIFRYILPEIAGTVAVTASLDVGSVVLSMAGLSFLGLGAARPTAEWGAVMSEARDYLLKAPWIIVFNGAALFFVVACFQLFGDGLRDLMNITPAIKNRHACLSKCRSASLSNGRSNRKNKRKKGE